MRTRSPIRFQAAMAAVAVLVLIAGCADARPGGSETSYQAMDEQQQASCDGIPAPKSLQLLPKSSTVVAAVMCVEKQKYLAGQGMWTYREVLPLPAAKIPTLVAALTAPDVKLSGNVACTASLALLPSFVVTLADGSRVRPGVPGDGCHPRMDAITAFGDIASITPRTEARTTSVLGDLQTTTSCADTAKSPAVWMGATSGSTRAARPVLPPSGSVSVCFYRATGDQEGTLTQAGIVPVQRLLTLWTQLPSGGTSACPPTSVDANSSAVDWLMFLPTPQPPYRYGDSGSSPIALLELGGCRRLVGVPAGLAGQTSAALATRLTALADRPVP